MGLLLSFFDYLNSINETTKINFTLEIADTEGALELLDLRIKWVEVNLQVDSYFRPSNSLPLSCHLHETMSCYPHHNIKNYDGKVL